MADVMKTFWGESLEAPESRKAGGQNVYSGEREMAVPELVLPSGLEFNSRLEMDGRDFLRLLPAECVPTVFFDPQYRGILDRMGYGNEGVDRGRQRSALAQMKDDTITEFMHLISEALVPSGHLFLWIDKFHLCTGFSGWHEDTKLKIVDLITWEKTYIGMGYRTRRKSEYLVVMQKLPHRAKGVWTIHDIPDVWKENARAKGWPHRKPVMLQQRLIEAVTGPGEVVVDPAAGSFSVMEACTGSGRRFLGCDLNG